MYKERQPSRRSITGRKASLKKGGSMKKRSMKKRSMKKGGSMKKRSMKKVSKGRTNSKGGATSRLRRTKSRSNKKSSA